MPGWIIMTIIFLIIMAVVLVFWAQHQVSRADQASQRRFFELLEKNSADGDIDHHWMRGVVRRMGHSI